MSSYEVFDGTHPVQNRQFWTANYNQITFFPAELYFNETLNHPTKYDACEKDLTKL